MNATNSSDVSAAHANNLGKQVWVLWDGECNFCRRSVNLLKSWDRHGIIYPIPYQDVPYPPMTPELLRECDRAVHVITENGQLLRAGRAALYVLRFTKYAPLAFWFTLPPLIWFVEFGYKIVAANRDFFSDLFFGKNVAPCAVTPTAATNTMP